MNNFLAGEKKTVMTLVSSIFTVNNVNIRSQINKLNFYLATHFYVSKIFYKHVQEHLRTQKRLLKSKTIWQINGKNCFKMHAKGSW